MLIVSLDLAGPATCFTLLLSSECGIKLFLTFKINCVLTRPLTTHVVLLSPV